MGLKGVVLPALGFPLQLITFQGRGRQRWRAPEMEGGKSGCLSGEVLPSPLWAGVPPIHKERPVIQGLSWGGALAVERGFPVIG